MTGAQARQRQARVYLKLSVILRDVQPLLTEKQYTELTHTIFRYVIASPREADQIAADVTKTVNNLVLISTRQRRRIFSQSIELWDEYHQP